METKIDFIANAVLLGAGATLMFDLCGLALKYLFGIPPSDICLIGRWLRYMPEGVFRHADIRAAAPKRWECPAGWIGHYSIGISFAALFLAWAGGGWLAAPQPVPAIAFGIVTVVAPFFVMQPALGLGAAASRTPNPGLARLRSLMNHTAFGVGLYVSALLAGWLPML